ncbi:ABC transporter ATP-binding protein [Agromyces silvae]|uniref:ABC transporter ATP-binding protein n=1 Tax=Agromyces silvae TaxID=3388266 RepID=UPI00280B9FE8|nr:oligopeptide/dipeptide ABC transporter ATP-binding protein [Agromyces protaetiae]
MNDPLLDVRDLEVHFRAPGRRAGARPVIRAVDGLSLQVREHEFLGVIGESGCGKSSMGRALVHLNVPTGGVIRYRGEDVTRPSRAGLRRLRREIQFVFQDPHSSLNGRQTVREILAEPLRAHGMLPRRGGDAVLTSLLESVGMEGAALGRYPHEFSGGQRQRIGLARGLALGPSLLVLDEPVSGLDVSVQAQVLNLLLDLKEQRAATFLMITHDLEVVRHSADRTAVMYLGKIVEVGPTQAVLDGPAHPYTLALASATPPADPWERRERIVLTGDLPSPSNPPSGCRFRTRCWRAQELCAVEEPQLRSLGDGRSAACHFPVGDLVTVSQHEGATV